MSNSSYEVVRKEVQDAIYIIQLYCTVKFAVSRDNETI
jgi:hypothetical protein